MDGVRLLLGESPFKNGQGTTQEKHREDTLIFIKYHLVIISPSWAVSGKGIHRLK